MSDVRVPVVPAILLRPTWKSAWGFAAIGPAMSIVYILRSHKDPTKYYVGLTEDLAKRLKEHNAGLSYYSKRYMPWYVETYVVFRNKSLAEKFEIYLKDGSGQAFLTKRLLPERTKPG